MRLPATPTFVGSCAAMTVSMQERRYEVTSDFTVFRQSDCAPKNLKTDFRVSVHEPLGNPVILEIGSERFENDKGGFLAHTITIAQP
jgi:hypothetical protein